ILRDLSDRMYDSGIVQGWRAVGAGRSTCDKAALSERVTDPPRRRPCQAAGGASAAISEEPDQPLDQALADDHVGDDFFLIVDRRRVGILRAGAGFGRLVYQADFRQVPLQGLLGERLLPRKCRVALSGGRRRLSGLPEPDQGIPDDIVFVGV